MPTRTRFVSAAIGVLMVCGPARGVVTEYTVESAWATAAGGVVRVIDFDDAALAQGASLGIAPTRYAALAGAPSLVGVASETGTGAPVLYRPSAADLTTAGVVPTSGQNVVQLTSVIVRNGILRITFNQPVVAVSGQLIDVETDLAANATGFRIAGSLAAIEVFTGNGIGQFFGVVSSVPFTSVDLELHPHVNPVYDGLALDDLKWVLASDCAGDVNGDGFTNAADFNILASNFRGTGKARSEGDLNGDGVVNAADFNILAGDFRCES